MAKMKITLKPLPDFKLPVTFNMPDGEQGEIVFTVRHIKAKEVQALYESSDVVSDSDFIMKLATGWNLEEEFNAENAAELVSCTLARLWRSLAPISQHWRGSA